MRLARYTEAAIGKVISMRCRRSNYNREVIVLDNTKLDQVHVYEQETIEGVIAFLQDVMNMDIVETDQPPVTSKLVNHQPTGYIYLIPHGDDDSRDDYHAFFAPVEAE